MKVSVICYAHNPRPEHLTATIESVIAQSHQDWEFLLIDDASDPKLLNYTGKYGGRYYGKLCCSRMPENYGMPNVHMLWGYGVRHTSGELVTCIGSDDIMWPNRLARVVSAFVDSPQLELLHHDALLIDKDGLIYKAAGDDPESYQHFPGPGRRTREQLYESEVQGQNLFAHPTVVMRRSVYEKVGYPEWGPCSDHNYWIRCLQAGVSMLYLPEMLLSYRVHAHLGASTLGPDKPRVAAMAGQMLEYWHARRAGRG